MVLLFWLFVFINIAAVVMPLVGLVLLLVAVVRHRNWQPGAWAMGLSGALLVWLALFSINLALTLGALGLVVAVGLGLLVAGRADRNRWRLGVALLILAAILLCLTLANEATAGESGVARIASQVIPRLR